MNITFTPTAWKQYCSHTDKKLLARIRQLIADIQRNGYEGIGKPEPLKGDLAPYWSRRIDHVHRLVYRIVGTGDEQTIEIVACRNHYGKD